MTVRRNTGDRRIYMLATTAMVFGVSVNILA